MPAFLGKRYSYDFRMHPYDFRMHPEFNCIEFNCIELLFYLPPLSPQVLGMPV
jgi:hypothetical protein